VNELRWETRLLAVVAATLVVFGIAMTYGASSLVRTKDGGVAGSAFALTQLTGALLGGVLMVTMHGSTTAGCALWPGRSCW
jgi:hypothetical protein